MPTPESHASGVSLLTGVSTIIASAMTPELVVSCGIAWIGAGVGLAFRPSEPVNHESNRAAVYYFIGQLAYISATAIVAIFSAYLMQQWFKTPVYYLCFFVSLILMTHRETVINIVTKMLNFIPSRAGGSK